MPVIDLGRMSHGYYNSKNDDAVDQLFLLPDSVLSMDTMRFRQDLACFDVAFPKHSFPNSLETKEPIDHGIFGGLQVTTAGHGTVLVDTGIATNVLDTSVKGAKLSSPPKDSPLTLNKEREERIRHFKEKQNEERQKKLEELKQQALAAQKFREQQELERKKRIEELKIRELERMQQVAERKKLIMEAEKERREAILKKNIERECRIEAKKRNFRSSGVFAFGSSTPRLLDTPGDNASFFRKATSTNNMAQLMPVSSSKRSIDKEIEATKKKATSAHGLDKKPRDADAMTQSFTSGVPIGRGRRRTDLCPAEPAKDRDSSKSPGRTISITRLDELSRPKKILSPDSEGPPPLNSPVRSKSKSMNHLAAGHKEVPTSINEPPSGGKLVKVKPEARSTSHLGPDKVCKTQPKGTRAERLRLRARLLGIGKKEGQVDSEGNFTGCKNGSVTPVSPSSRPISAMSHLSTSSVVLRKQTSKPRPISIAGTVPDRKTMDKSLNGNNSKNPQSYSTSTPKKIIGLASKGTTPTSETNKNIVNKPLEKYAPKRKDSNNSNPRLKNKVQTNDLKHINDENFVDLPMLMDVGPPLQEDSDLLEKSVGSMHEDKSLAWSRGDSLNTGDVLVNSFKVTKVIAPLTNACGDGDVALPSNLNVKNTGSIENGAIDILVANTKKNTNESNRRDSNPLHDLVVAMSGGGRQRITTEEEAKAAIAKKRRLAREQAEREAAEKRRLEEELRRKEEEELRVYERQMEQQRKFEEERLKRAIEDAKKKQEEQKEREEREALLKQEKEEMEKKAREEAERQRQENEERLRKEEEERQARRKRVEAIMSRTRGKANNSSPNDTPTRIPTKVIGPPKGPTYVESLEEDGTKVIIFRPVNLGNVSDRCELGMDLSPCDIRDPTCPDLLEDIPDRTSPIVNPFHNGDNKVNNLETNMQVSDKVLRLDSTNTLVKINQENLLLSTDTLSNEILDNIKVQNASNVTVVLSSGDTVTELDPLPHQSILSNEDSINSNIGTQQIITLDDNIGMKSEGGNKITGTTY